jgi:RNA polymerase sigma-70 factor, ECF subfamily
LLSDGEIIRRVRGGRAQDFRTLIERYEGAVFTLAYRMLGRREEAEDAAQDTFIKVFRSLNSYSDSAPFWAWLRKIAVNSCLNNLPREFPSDEVETALDLEQPFVDAVQAEVLRKCELEQMDAVIAGLPEMYRTVVVLRYREDLSFDEIADALGQTPGAVRVRLHRAVKMLSERLAVVDNEL